MPNHAAVMEQLYNVEVYSAQEITLEWVVEPDASKPLIVGRADSGRVKLTLDEGNCLRIFIKENAVSLPCPPLELQEELAKFCCIIDAGHCTVLHWLLAENNLEEIEDIFQRRGISNELPAFDLISKAPSRHALETVLATHIPSYLPFDVPSKADTQRKFHGRREASGTAHKGATHDGV